MVVASNGFCTRIVSPALDQRRGPATPVVLLAAIAKEAARFDVIHCHTDWLHIPMLRCLSAPFLTTLHGRVDLGRAPLSGRISAFGRMVATKRVVHVTDLSAEQSYFERAPEAVTAVELGNIRTIVFVPVLKEDELIGGIAGASATDLSWRPWPHAPGPCRGAGWGEGSDGSRGSTPCKAKSLNPLLVNRPCNDQKRRNRKRAS